MDEQIIKVQNINKHFRLPYERQTGLKQVFVNFYRRKRGYESQPVLKDITFAIKQGEFFGIVGRNGSGKSTLLKLLAGIYVPESGSIYIGGSLTPFIELGVGFNPELTGRENVFLNGALLGFDRKQMRCMYKEIVDFAELHEFMDQKLKNYSSGMQVRLAFSVAIRAESDILLIDEVLAVGDAAFQTKCFDYFYKLKERGRTVILVSHDRSALERFCDRGVLIHEGRVASYGLIKNVLNDYNQIVLDNISEAAVAAESASTQNASESDYALIKNVQTLARNNKPTRKFHFGEPITASFEVEVRQELENPILGLTLWLKNFTEPVFATNTFIAGNPETGAFRKGQHIHFMVVLPDGLNNGEYYIEPAIANDSGTYYYDTQPKAHSFVISGSNNPYSLLHTTNKITLEKQ